MSGAGLRLGRLFRRESRRSFMVAFDRTLLEGPAPFGVDARATLERIVAAGPEAVLVGPGLLKRCGDLFAHRGAPAVVLRIDYPMVAEFSQGGREYHRMVCDPEHAARLGADAAVMCLVEGYADADNYALNVTAVAEAARRCADVGLPLIVESVLWGARARTRRTRRASPPSAASRSSSGRTRSRPSTPARPRACAPSSRPAPRP